jgi:hypothetical protein
MSFRVKGANMKSDTNDGFSKKHTVYSAAISTIALVTALVSCGVSIYTCSQNQEANQIAKDANSLTADSNATSLKTANEANQLSRRSHKIAKEANDIAREAKDEAKAQSRVALQVHWNALRNDYDAVDEQILEWEKSEGLLRNGKVAQSNEELQTILTKLKVPSDIQRLYFLRADKRRSLEQAIIAFEPFRERMVAIDFSLPAVPEPAKLPRAAITAGGNYSVGGN